MRLLVSGTRHQSPEIRKLVDGELDFYFDQWESNLFLILGDAKGVDTYAREWAEKREIDHVICYANWRGFGRSAGVIRNSKMMSFVPEKAVVFPAPDSKGTLNMISQLAKGRVTTRKVSVSIP